MEKLFPKESVEGADTVLKGRVRAPEGKPEAAKNEGAQPPRFCSRGLVANEARRLEFLMEFTTNFVLL